MGLVPRFPSSPLPLSPIPVWSKGKEKVWWEEDVWRVGRVVLSPQGTVLQGMLGQLCPDTRVCVGLRPACDNSLAAMAELLREAGSALPAYWLRQQ